MVYTMWKWRRTRIPSGVTKSYAWWSVCCEYKKFFVWRDVKGQNKITAKKNPLVQGSRAWSMPAILKVLGGHMECARVYSDECLRTVYFRNYFFNWNYRCAILSLSLFAKPKFNAAKFPFPFHAQPMLPVFFIFFFCSYLFIRGGSLCEWGVKKGKLLTLSHGMERERQKKNCWI